MRGFVRPALKGRWLAGRGREDPGFRQAPGVAMAAATLTRSLNSFIRLWQPAMRSHSFRA